MWIYLLEEVSVTSLGNHGGESVKILVKSRLNRFPLVYALAIRTWRTIKWFLVKCRWNLLTFIDTSSREVRVERIRWVSPQRISYCSLQGFDIYDFGGRAIGGTWDLLEKKFEDLDVYVAFKQVFVEGKEWAQTVFYQRVLDRLSRGDILWGCKDENDLKRRCQDLEVLYQKIGHEGYKS